MHQISAQELEVGIKKVAEIVAQMVVEVFQEMDLAFPMDFQERHLLEHYQVLHLLATQVSMHHQLSS